MKLLPRRSAQKRRGDRWLYQQELILVPRAHDPSGLRQGSWALGTRMFKSLNSVYSRMPGQSDQSGSVQDLPWYLSNLTLVWQRANFSSQCSHCTVLYGHSDVVCLCRSLLCISSLQSSHVTSPYLQKTKCSCERRKEHFLVLRSQLQKLPVFQIHDGRLRDNQKCLSNSFIYYNLAEKSGG